MYLVDEKSKGLINRMNQMQRIVKSRFLIFSNLFHSRAKKRNICYSLLFKADYPSLIPISTSSQCSHNSNDLSFNYTISYRLNYQ
mmetsp:Transcript_30387/g.63699  ORF Transcript_30387/g.63699 Transcript_30387/m.63699 type:complete len:85 (+) Transcript_30387:1125-1379(+)